MLKCGFRVTMCCYFQYNCLKRNYYYLIIRKLDMEKEYNRLKVVLAEKRRTNKWLAEQLGKDPATVSKWCTNSAQPGLETLFEIAEQLDVDVKDLLNSTREGKNGVIYKK